jgi:hypothetical protein
MFRKDMLINIRAVTGPPVQYFYDLIGVCVEDKSP